MIQFAFFYWDPKPEIFVIPIVHYPVLWYGALFALGFILGFPICVSILNRSFLLRPQFEPCDIKGDYTPATVGKGETIVSAMNTWLYADTLIDGERVVGLIPRRLRLEKSIPDGINSLKKQAANITDKLTFYVVVATVLGARIGHLVFYENPSYYLANPLEIFAVWKGGLSSHGAAISIPLALLLFSYRYRSHLRHLNFLGLLDFVCVPTALAGACIRVGNFFNQEILGIATTVPWAVIFGHPADNSLPTPRHPVQLYEAAFYLIVFCVLWSLTFKPKFLQERGRLMGLFLMLVFGFRMIVEYWKLEQSVLVPVTFDWTMGQLLSIPLVLVGAWLYFRKIRSIL
jgi:phosphatidylglycerol:prolipoprotein diacylglycerol transferase